MFKVVLAADQTSKVVLAAGRFVTWYYIAAGRCLNWVQSRHSLGPWATFLRRLLSHRFVCVDIEGMFINEGNKIFLMKFLPK